MIVDGHLDIAWNALAFGRGFDGPGTKGYLVTRSALEQAGVGLVFATLFAAPGVEEEMVGTGAYYRNAREARLLALSQLNYYGAVGLPLVRRRRDLGRPGLQAVVLMEGADPIESPAQVADWWERGVRIVGLAWQRTGKSLYAGAYTKRHAGFGSRPTPTAPLPRRHPIVAGRGTSGTRKIGGLCAWRMAVWHTCATVLALQACESYNRA